MASIVLANLFFWPECPVNSDDCFSHFRQTFGQLSRHAGFSAVDCFMFYLYTGRQMQSDGVLLECR